MTSLSNSGTLGLGHDRPPVRATSRLTGLQGRDLNVPSQDGVCRDNQLYFEGMGLGLTLLHKHFLETNLPGQLEVTRQQL